MEDVCYQRALPSAGIIIIAANVTTSVIRRQKVIAG